MDNPITVQEAIERGRKNTLLPRLLLGLGLLVFSLPLALLCLSISNYTKESKVPILVLSCASVVLFIIGIVLPFWFWSKRLTQWKLWAFAGCSDVQELRKIARLKALYFEGDLVGGLLITTSAERLAWAQLQQKFHAPVNVADNPRLPPETIIGISWSHLLFNLFIQLAGIFLGVLILFYAPPGIRIWAQILAVGLVIALLYTMFTFMRATLIRKPILIISNKGIQTIHTGFSAWSAIENERIMQRSLGPSAQSDFLCYDLPKGKEELKLTIYAVSRAEIEHLLYLYRNRYNSLNK